MRLVLTLVLALVGLNAQLPVRAEETTRPTGQVKMPDAISLSESDIRSFLGVLPALKDLGLGNEVVTANPDDVAGIVGLNQQAMDILDDFGFTPQSFQQVSYSIGLALAGLQAQGREREIEAVTRNREQILAQMEGQLSDEEMALLREQLDTAMGVLGQMQEQPPGNLALVGKYQDQITSLLDSM